jgi:hypothetical protein
VTCRPVAPANDLSGPSGATSRRDYASYPPHRWPRTAGGTREVDRQTATIHCNASGAPPTSDRPRGSGTGHVRAGWTCCARSSASTPWTRRCRRPTSRARESEPKLLRHKVNRCPRPRWGRHVNATWAAARERPGCWTRDQGRWNPVTGCPCWYRNIVCRSASWH